MEGCPSQFLCPAETKTGDSQLIIETSRLTRCGWRNEWTRLSLLAKPVWCATGADDIGGEGERSRWTERPGDSESTYGDGHSMWNLYRMAICVCVVLTLTWSARNGNGDDLCLWIDQLQVKMFSGKLHLDVFKFPFSYSLAIYSLTKLLDLCIYL